MSNKKMPSLSRWHAEMANDRAKRPEVREERLRSTMGLRGTAAPALSAWRGLSGRRYVVGIHSLDIETAADALPAALIAARRGDIGLAQIVDLYSGEAGAADVGEWVRRAVASGATELHIHRLADGADARAAAITDLTAPLSEAA